MPPKRGNEPQHPASLRPKRGKRKHPETLPMAPPESLDKGNREKGAVRLKEI